MNASSSSEPLILPGRGIVRGGVRAALRLEGAAALALSAACYFREGESGWLFVALFLAPDLSFLGFALGRRVGAWCYNLLHTYSIPLVLLALSAWAPQLRPVALIWVSHIGWDRLLGYGLKYETGFGDTHLGRMGRAGTGAAGA